MATLEPRDYVNRAKDACDDCADRWADIVDDLERENLRLSDALTDALYENDDLKGRVMSMEAIIKATGGATSEGTC
jgi:hypothetical protein